VQTLRPEWTGKVNASLGEKLDLLNKNEVYSIFPLYHEVSHEIERELFASSHLIQPDLFLRIRPGKTKGVVQKIKEAGIHFSIDGDCIRLPNNTKLEGVLALDRDVVVQDKSSQQVLNPLKDFWQREKFAAWDCCAASGGKTILLHDEFPKAQLVVSDIRESILHNLRSRFRRAGIQQFHSFVADLSSRAFPLSQKFDIIICDAPCSGSGTWGRTPEQLHFFSIEKIDHYTKLQTEIATNASRSLKQDGLFIYITCSVFRRENEQVVQQILQHTEMKLLKQQYIKGYTEKADTLFTALFQL
jgi:16S rRNA (cytosine967-C5)-methyltransferase